MKRFYPKTGEMFLPWRYKDGSFRVADPSLGEAKKLKENQIAVDDEGDLAGYVRRGFHVRMRGGVRPDHPHQPRRDRPRLTLHVVMPS